ncbi:citrate lyase subunit beta / citryl-CoA lyase [Pseudomonas delhiensis]|uniref:Citrate lyase subunit beta / citryl-CoA lyase n=1 Tax=Pseudomonas delhiensis TaxID=366289 RepID=A0A239JSB1_9PSED|nr:CoA ester lyase [Pseudomonas delhiensis]SDJ97643.1 citrate lyase subunit beta / citryl-CoA lyase [Pseudomonas delhiensis]SNT08771.1 citrate lyase subunit beta / citryl-CoA lyase [Pseudomonas delhiensis]
MSDFRLGEAILFCPADRPDRYEKALARADRVILDLEDAVSPAAKARARRCVIDALPRLGDRVMVRINASASASAWHDEDLKALRELREQKQVAPWLMLPKAESPAQLEHLGDFSLVALCETARGVTNAGALAASANCVALFWGGEDLVADLGGCRSRDPSGRYYPLIEQARGSVLLAAASHGKAAIDAVHIDIADVEGLARESREAADLGFRAKACIHPSHVALIREAFRPDEARCRWAEAVLGAMKGAQGGVAALDGQMIDEPLFRQALRILEAAGRSPGCG